MSVSGIRMLTSLNGREITFTVYACNSCGVCRRHPYTTIWGERICIECLRLAEKAGLVSTETI